MNKLTKMMIEHLNLKLKEKGSNLRYVESFRDCGTISYRLTMQDKYIDNTFDYNVSTTKEFDEVVRAFFKQYNVVSTGF